MIHGPSTAQSLVHGPKGEARLLLFCFGTGPQGSKNPVFLKSPTQWVFWVLLGFGVLLGFVDKQEKIGKIIQKLSNLKP